MGILHGIERFAGYLFGGGGGGTQLSLSPPAPLPASPSPRYDADNVARWDRWTTHPEHGLTEHLDRIPRIFREAEGGYPAIQCDLFEGVLEQDEHLRSVYEDRITAVAGNPWLILPQPGADTEADQYAARELERALRLVPDWYKVVEHQLTFNGYGYAGTQIKWGFRDGLWVPTWFGNVPHRRFRFDDFDTPRLLTQDSRVDGVPLERGSWWFTTRMGRSPARAGLMRTATWLSAFKRMSVRDWVVFGRRFGIPFITGKYPPEMAANKKQMDEAERALRMLGEDAVALIPKMLEIDVKELGNPGSAKEVFAMLADRCEAGMTKLFLGGTLSKETTSHSNYASAYVHQDKEFRLCAADALRLGTEFAEAVAAPFCHFNGIPVTRPPWLKLELVREVDPLKRAQIAEKCLNGLGLELDEDQVRQEFRWKKPTGTALKPRQPTVPASAKDDAE